MFRKVFFLLLLFVGFLNITAVKAAQVTCQLTGGTFVQGQPVTISGSLCDPSLTNYQLVVVDTETGDDIDTIDLSIANNGSFTQTLGDYGVGNFLVIVHTGNFAERVETTFEVTESTNPVTYDCGDFVPSSDVCPADCPYKPESATGVVPHTPAVCDCGGPGQRACPAGNEAGLDTCRPLYVLDPATNTCVLGEEDVERFQCGETISFDQFISGSYQCQIGCELDETSLTCACGSEGQGCCPSTPGGSNFPGTCNNPFLECLNPGICRVNTEGGDRYPYLCEDLNSVRTAIGCVEFTTINTIVARVSGFLLGLGGGVALILIAFAAFRIMTSHGDPKALQGGKEILASAVSGLLMVAFSVYILRVIGVDILGLFG